MKRIFIFDTETTGFLNRGSELVQIAGHTLGWTPNQHVTIQEFSTLVQHEKESPVGALNIHGITKQVGSYGTPAKQVANWYLRQVAQADLVVAHNLAFDAPFMKEVIVREGLPVPTSMPNVYCTMKATTPLCKIPKQKGNGYKWPKLEEALRILLNQEITDAHDALGDVRSTRALLLWLLDNGHLKL